METDSLASKNLSHLSCLVKLHVRRLNMTPVKPYSTRDWQFRSVPLTFIPYLPRVKNLLSEFINSSFLGAKSIYYKLWTVSYSYTIFYRCRSLSQQRLCSAQDFACVEKVRLSAVFCRLWVWTSLSHGRRNTEGWLDTLSWLLTQGQRPHSFAYYCRRLHV